LVNKNVLSCLLKDGREVAVMQRVARVHERQLSYSGTHLTVGGQAVNCSNAYLHRHMSNSGDGDLLNVDECYSKTKAVQTQCNIVKSSCPTGPAVTIESLTSAV